MDIIIERGSGIDVHKESLVACIMGTGHKKFKENLPCKGFELA